MRLSPIIRKLVNQLYVRFISPCFARTLAASTLSFAAGAVLLSFAPVMADTEEAEEENDDEIAFQYGAYVSNKMRGGVLDLTNNGGNDTTTYYYQWVEDENKNLRLLAVSHNEVVKGLPQDTESYIAVNFSKTFGTSGKAYTYSMLDRYLGGPPDNAYNPAYDVNPTLYQRRGPLSFDATGTSYADTFTVRGNGFTEDKNGKPSGIDEAQKIYLNNAVDRTLVFDASKKDVNNGAIQCTFIQNYTNGDYVHNVTALARKDTDGNTFLDRPTSVVADDAKIPETTLAATDRLWNDALAWGGMLVFNEKTGEDNRKVTSSLVSRIDSIRGDIIGNYSNNHYVAARGGLIYNGFLGYIGEISANFIGNNFGINDKAYDQGLKDKAAYEQKLSEKNVSLRTSHAGVIYNHTNGTIGTITGNFISNGLYLDLQDAANLQDAIANRVDVIGGVLVNHGLIEKGVHITAIGNYVYSSTVANSGVMRNYSASNYTGVIGANEDGVSIDGVYIGNYARAVTGDAYGGIMRNNGSIEGTIKGYYIGNYASTDGNLTTMHYTYIVDKEGYGHGHYMYDPTIDGRGDKENDPYISYEDAINEANKKGTTINPEDFYLKRQDLERYHTGERSGQAQGGVFYNTIKDDGSAATDAVLSDIDAYFEKNYVVSKWGEASGGVLYNQDAIVADVTGTFSGNYAISLAHMARGGAIYNKLLGKKEATIGNIGNAKEPVDFIGNYAQGRIAGGGAIYASSYSTIGKIHGNFYGNHADSKLGLTDEEDLKTYNSEAAHFEKHTDLEEENCPEYYEYRARGGALFVDNYAEVDDITVDDFSGNYVVNTDKLGAKVRGGAILVTTGGMIGHIGGLNNDHALFSDNYALGMKGNEQNTFGGAIRFDNSVIERLSANFSKNWTTGSGGALSLTESGFIYEVTGWFEGNQAGHLGGAVHNLGTIGYLGNIIVEYKDADGNTVRKAVKSINDLRDELRATDKDRQDSIKDYDMAVRGENDRILTESDETQKRNKGGRYEYDGSIRGGFINTSFIGNVVDGVGILVEEADGRLVLKSYDGDHTGSKETRDGARGLGGAIYTTDHLFITANDQNTIEIRDNQVRYKGEDGFMDANGEGVKTLNTALYVDSTNRAKEDPITIYLVATEGANIVVRDAIRGAEDSGYGFVLRLRGYSEQYDYTNPDTKYLGGGTILLSGPVAQSYTIMDDVTLQIGTCVNYFSYGAGEAAVQEVNSYLPDYISKDAERLNIYDRSDVFRKSHLSVRSGIVDLTSDNNLTPGDPYTQGNTGITQFLFSSLSAFGKTYRYADNGTNDALIAQMYEKNDLYAKWMVDVRGSGDPTKKGEMGVADLITVISEVDEKGNFLVGSNNSEGRVTLSEVNIKYDKSLDYTYKKGEKVDAPVRDEFTFKAQILNIVLKDKNGNTLTEDQYAQTKYLTSDSPLQLDNDLNIVAFEHSDMLSSEILAEDIRLATTRTYHDSIEIIGWRDNLAAWAEMTDDASQSRYDEPGCYWDKGTYDAQKKRFTLTASHDLTRNVCDLTAEDKWEQTDGAVWGKDWTIRGLAQSFVLNLNDKNLLTVVKDHQKARLENFTLRQVQNRKMLNEGDLTLDTMKVADSLRVNNQNTLTLQGHMTIDKSITITTDPASEVATLATGSAADAEWKQMYINDETEVFKDQKSGKTVLNITVGTIEKQDITHQGSTLNNAEALEKGSTTELTNDIMADKNFTTVTNLYTTDSTGKTTEGFRNFTQNSLTMEGGKLNLGVMGYEVLWLRGLHMRGGLIHVASSTVDLANERMGGLRGEVDGRDYASYTGGVIWLDNIKLVSDGGMVTHVKFVTSDAGDAVKDNKIRNTYMWGPKYEYLVTYNDQERLNDRGEPGQNGYYTFSRTDRMNPTIFAEPVAELTGGFTQMLQVYDYSFMHADMFSATMENTRQPLEDAPMVVHVKGYKEVGQPGPSCPTNEAALHSGLWVRPYVNFEKMNLNNGPRVNSTIYGALVGGDSDLKELGNGWAAVTSAFGAYMGARQTYEGNRTNQNGLGVGLTETFYKRRFYTAVTLSAALSDVRTNTPYGTEDYSMLMAGVASRTGYSMNLGTCRYVLQPTLLMSYSFINASDYVNAAGVRMESSPLQVFQVHPYLKGIMHSDSGWDPYLTAGYVHNFMGETSYRADGDKLPELSIDPYLEYSAGVQKTWNSKYTFYGQATGRQGGRQGVEVSAGLRCTW